MNFSFSGLKTALLYKSKDMTLNELKTNRANIAFSYQDAIIETLLHRLKKVIEKKSNTKSFPDINKNFE